MICECCGKDLPILYRANAKGQKALWYCEGCMGERPIDPEVKEITEIFSGQGGKMNN